MSLHSAPCNLTRFPFSACIGYSSRLWCAMHPFLAIPYALAYAIVACMAISSRAALPYAHPNQLRYYSRRSPHHSAYAVALFGWVPYDCRAAFAAVDFAHCAAFGVRMSDCQRASETKFATMEINANKSTPRPPHPRFYWRFRIFTVFLREANRAKSAVWRGDA